jgi:dephospho-CoA kinase
MTSSSDPHHLFIVGLTGSIGSGKSQVADLFKELGAELIDADLLAREAVGLGSAALAQIERVFGSSVITNSGELDRAALAKLVFSDEHLRTALEDIVHPHVRRLFLDRLSRFKSKPRSDIDRLVIYVVPLLFESRYPYPEIENTVVVSAARETCIARIMSRDHCSREQAQLRHDSQLPNAEKEKRADWVIHNEGTLEQLRERVTSVYRSIIKGK